MDGSSASLLELQSEVCQIGVFMYEFEELHPACKSCFEECWQRLDIVEAKIQHFTPISTHLHYVLSRIERHLNFGESLEDLG
jgi:hypothetical protein